MRDAIKKIADGVRSFIKGVMTDGKYQGAHNVQAQPWIDDLKVLNSLAQKLSNALDSARENVQKYGQKINTQRGVRYSVDENFYKTFDEWDGKNSNITFTIGNTSEALKSIGVKDQKIIMRSGMVLQKLNKHKEMTKDLFRQIPQLIEEPIIIEFSDAIDPATNKPKYDSRITILGELYAKKDGKDIPVLVSLELMPTNQKGTKLLDFSVITSAYGHSKFQRYLNENSILYINLNKKTDKWLSLNRLQLPLGENHYGLIKNITYSDGKVKIQNSKNSTKTEDALRKAGLVDEFGEVKKLAVDDSINDITETRQFKRWFGDWQNNPENASKVVDNKGKPLVVYHGTSRADRVGNIFLPERATSGPMAFFTDSKEIAGNYARDKADTSIAYDEDYDSYYTQFRVIKNGKNIAVSDLWSTLSYAEKLKIKERAKHIKIDDDYETVIYDKAEQYGLGAFDNYTINYHNGNIIDVLIDNWLESGVLLEQAASTASLAPAQNQQ